MSHSFLRFSRTHRAPAFLLARSGVDGRFPDMPLAASPPHPLVASRRHHLRRQTAVQTSVPLGSDFRMERGQIVEASQNSPPCAVWAAGVLHDPCGYDSLPFMSKGAPPPDLPVAERSYLIGRQPAVVFRVPLRSDVWIERRYIVLAGYHCFPRANRASSASAPAQDACPPRMTLITFPLDISLASCQHV